MPGGAGTGHRWFAVRLAAAATAALGGALVVIQISRLAEVRAALSFKHAFTPGQMTELGHCIAIERDQNPANPSGLL